MKGLRFYRERNGDYLVADFTSADYYRRIGWPTLVDGRATAIAGLATSVCGIAITRGYLRKCRRVRRSDVPTKWLGWLIGKE